MNDGVTVLLIILSMVTVAMVLDVFSGIRFYVRGIKQCESCKSMRRDFTCRDRNRSQLRAAKWACLGYENAYRN